MPPLPLDGVRVLDLSPLLPGPYATQLLSDLGAEVVKVERIGEGDPARGLRSIFLGVNRNKQSIAIDLKRQEGVEVVRRLAKTCDVALEGFRPGVVERLGVGYAALSAVNPALIYCSISGFGQNGPYSKRPGHDVNYMAAAGAIDPKAPRVAALPIADLSAGSFAALSIVAALYRARETGEGTHIDLAMTDAVLSWMATRMNPEVMPDGKRDLAASVPCYGIFETNDGRHLALGIVHEDHFWRRFCELVGFADLASLTTAERGERCTEVADRLTVLFRQHSLAEWEALLPADELPVTPIKTIDEARKDPHHHARNSIYELDDLWQTASPWPKEPDGKAHPAPALGQHTRSVLVAAGFSDTEVMELLGSGVIGDDNGGGDNAPRRS